MSISRASYHATEQQWVLWQHTCLHMPVFPGTCCSPPYVGCSHHAGNALYDKDAERSMRDIEATLLVCAQQCAVDDEDEVCRVC